MYNKLVMARTLIHTLDIYIMKQTEHLKREKICLKELNSDRENTKIAQFHSIL
jgi:hypothetical protein